MQIQQEEGYEDLGAEYQYQLVRLLNLAMKKAGVVVSTRRAVAEDFIFDMAMLHDQTGITVDETELLPVLAFRDGDVLRLPNSEFALHEYAHGNVDQYYDEDEANES